MLVSRFFAIKASAHKPLPLWQVLKPLCLLSDFFPSTSMPYGVEVDVFWRIPASAEV